MPIIIKCDCGKTLKIDEKYRGRQAACPVCKKAVMVEGPNEDCSASVLIEPEASVHTHKPAPQPAKASAPPAEDPANPFAVSTTGPSTRARRRSLAPWVTAGCGLLTVVLSCCGGISFGVYYFFLRPYDEDFKFVHSEVLGFYSVRVGDILKSSTFKEQFGKMPMRDRETFDKKMAEIDKKLGLTFSDIERVTFVSRTGVDTAIVVRTAKAMSKKKIFATFSAEKSEKKEGNDTYYILESPNEIPLVLHFVNDRLVLIVRSEAAMRDFLNAAGKPATDPALKRGVKLASSGSYAMVAAYKVEQQIAQDLFRGEMPLPPSLRDMTGVVVATAVDSHMNVEIYGLFSSSDQASRAKSDVESAVQKFKEKPGMLGGDKIISGMLDSVSVTQSGSEVVVRAKSEFPVGLITQQIRSLRIQSPGQKQSRENMEQIARAIREYERVNGKFPAGGHKGTVSWRVLILPYLPGTDRMIEQINVNDAYDSPQNRKFWDKMPKVYQLPNKPNDGRTYYQVFRGPDSAFPEVSKDIRIQDIKDGLANTIFVVEATNPVEWMRPEDLSFRVNTTGYSGKSLGNHWGDDTFHAAFGDDRVRRLPRSIDPLTLQAMITRAHEEKVNPSKHDEDPRDNIDPRDNDEP